jgi:putative FmdB family regulatory protein
MPIYEYRCSSCGHQQEFLQKVSDAPLSVCTSCGQPTFTKMLTAAGFQLKGSGWYATDFKGKGKAPAAATGSGSGGSTPAAGSGASGDSKADGSKGEGSTGEGTKASGHACGSGGCGACN